jgi:chromosome segregation ATPase
VIPIVGNVLGPIHTAGHSNQLERSFKRQAKEKLPQVVNKLITQATTDLEKQKKKVLKKMDALIEARNQEVVEAKKAIQALETVNQELAHKNKDLREKSDREIISLRDQIKELNEQLADFQKRKEEVEKAVRSKLYGKSEKLKIKAKMTDEKTQIAELEKELEDVRLIAKTLDESLGNERLQLEKTRSQLERETSRLNEDLKAKEDELERERKIAHDKIQSLNDEIKQWKKRKEEIEKERNKLDETNTDLEAKNKELKQKYEKAQAAADK